MKNTLTSATGYQPQTGDRILCDPNYSPEDRDHKKTPNPTRPANIISVHKRHVVLEIIDDRYLNGRRNFTNTSLYGSTCSVLLNAIIKQS